MSAGLLARAALGLGRRLAAWGLRREALAYAAGSRRQEPEWRPERRSEDAVLRQDAATLRGRARELVANVPNLAGAMERIVSNVIFDGIWPQVSEQPGLSQAQARALEQRWWQWACREHVDLVGLQELVLRHLWLDGGCLVGWDLDPELLREGFCPLLPVGLEYEHLDWQRCGVQPSGLRAWHGIEHLATGRAAAYWLLPEHPGDGLGFGAGQSVRVEARHLQHVYRRTRFAQHAGASWLAAVLLSINSLNDYLSSELIAARLVAKFGLFVKSSTPEYGLGLPGFGAGVAPAGGTAWDELTDQVRGLALESGTVQLLPQGTDITSPEFNRPGGTFDPFVKLMLRRQSVALGLSYEAYSNDYSGASYSSVRSASLEERRGYQVQQQLLIRKFLQPLWERWVTVAWSCGLAPRPQVAVTWTTPGWPWVDPVKDAAAAKLRVELGVSSRTREAAAQGVDFFDELAVRARERAAMAAAGEEPGLPGAGQPGAGQDDGQDDDRDDEPDDRGEPDDRDEDQDDDEQDAGTRSREEQSHA